LGGDLTDFGSPDDPEYLVRQAQATGATVWAVAGNCDSPLIDERLAQLGVSLHGRGVVYQGLGLQGLSAMPPWRSSMYSFTEQELSGFLGAGHSSIAQAKTRIVLSHAPPHGVRDRTGLFRHVGSTALRDFIQETQPALVLCGHIHEARGVDSLGRTVVVNCGAAKNGYYAVADVTESGEVRTELRRE
jgi:Icc-related predicted phosphoesterase